VEPLAPHEKLFVDTDFLEEDGNHGSIDCHRCHGGDPKDPDWRTAHKDLIKDPTYPDSESACGDCHDVENYKKSLHVSLEPYRVTMKTRGGNDKAAHKKLDKAFDTYCGQCHASCGWGTSGWTYLPETTPHEADLHRLPWEPDRQGVFRRKRRIKTRHSPRKVYEVREVPHGS